MFRTVVVLVGLGLSAAAFGNSNTMTGRPGFFEPTPDGNSSLTKLGVPEQRAAPGAAQPDAAPGAAQANVPGVVSATASGGPIAREDAIRKAEATIDRAEQEHEKLTERSQQSATTLQGAFNGLTGETNR